MGTETKIQNLEAAMEALRASQRQFRAVAQSAIDAIVSLDNVGKIVFWNRAAEKMFGYSAQEVRGKAVTFIIPPDLRERHTEGVIRYITTGRARYLYHEGDETPAPEGGHRVGSVSELRALHRDGHEFPIELALSSWDTPTGPFFSAIIRDITERKEAQRIQKAYADALEERNQELLAYDRTIAHDLKAPVGVVTTYTDLINQQFAGEIPEKAREYLERIRKSSGRMQDMIDQLLWLATLRDAEEVIAPVDIYEVIEHALARLHDRIEEERVNIIVEENIPNPMGQALWIEEVVTNLISNAIKYKGKSNTAPQITIRGVGQEHLIRYEVEDNGLGIPEDKQTELFKMFTRTHTDEARGFGLGLSIVQRIITRLNGQVGVNSVPGQGSTFWFALPPAADNSA